MFKRLWKGKGVPMSVGTGIALILLAVVMGAGMAEAAIEVQNWADLIYRSSPNIATAFTYARTDSAVLRIMYGPEMRLSKWLRNEVSSDTGDTVKVNRGDTITVILEAWNDQLNADTTAHHVVIYDTFLVLRYYDTGDTGVSVGPSATANSFTYVPWSEMYVSGDSYVAPTKIAYYDYTDQRWEGQGGAAVNITDPYDANWIAYGDNWEDQVNGAPGNSKYITGIAWYWPQVFCDRDDEGNPQDKPYKIRVEFQLKKNDN